MTKVESFFAWFIVGGIVGIVVLGHLTSRQIEHLQRYADSVSVVADSVAAQAIRYGDSLLTVNRALAAQRRPALAVARVDSAVVVALDTALTRARTLGDSAAVLTQQVGTLRAENVRLWDVVRLDSLMLRAATARGDSLQAALAGVNASVQALTAQVNKLRGQPRWLRITLEAGKDAALVYAGVQWGRAQGRR